MLATITIVLVYTGPLLVPLFRADEPLRATLALCAAWALSRALGFDVGALRRSFLVIGLAWVTWASLRADLSPGPVPYHPPPGLRPSWVLQALGWRLLGCLPVCWFWLVAGFRRPAPTESGATTALRVATVIALVAATAASVHSLRKPTIAEWIGRLPLAARGTMARADMGRVQDPAPTFVAYRRFPTNRVVPMEGQGGHPYPGTVDEPWSLDAVRRSSVVQPSGERVSRGMRVTMPGVPGGTIYVGRICDGTWCSAWAETGRGGDDDYRWIGIDPLGRATRWSVDAPLEVRVDAKSWRAFALVGTDDVQVEPMPERILEGFEDPHVRCIFRDASVPPAWLLVSWLAVLIFGLALRTGRPWPVVDVGLLLVAANVPCLLWAIVPGA
ncbi:MAG: hypothetical protein U0230_10525 [Polyangiales bacterium]